MRLSVNRKLQEVFIRHHQMAFIHLYVRKTNNHVRWPGKLVGLLSDFSRFKSLNFTNALASRYRAMSRKSNVLLIEVVEELINVIYRIASFRP